MECTITGARCYSADLPQGGLEVPCELRFKGNAQDVAKRKKLLKDRLLPLVRERLPR